MEELISLKDFLDQYTPSDGSWKERDGRPAGGKKKRKPSPKRVPRPDGWKPAEQFVVVDMAAFGKARPRVTKNGTFMPKKYKDNSSLLRVLFGELTVSPPMIVAVTAVRPMPKGWSKKKRGERAGTFALPTPDVDNLLGSIMDVLMKDDSGVVAAVPVKIWGDVGKMIIHLVEVDELQVWGGLTYENDTVKLL